ncbi:hypothetical protein [Prauserella cavernicola]|uniref:Uncharacterized protein n=1 Tax=Prauserella cavernicola TaxID=2800127 RepID=A0A934QN74_9PSEU|nr:hypothetical protein [Prauserella cavernicola]MBK1785107.1 hypothetical protein [Prauserella cavernicola]
MGAVMGARWEERQDGREAGRVEVASAAPTPAGGVGCPLVAAPLAFAALYLVIHTLVWLGQVLLP